MANLNILVLRERTVNLPGAESFTPGVVYANGLKFCVSCEDADRKLEKVGTGAKIKGVTAIPRGKYKLVTSMSRRFGKVLPEVLEVPGFEGIRFHGGNKAENSEGCILIGQVRTSTGIANCADTVARLIAMVQTTVASGGECWLEVA